MHWGLCTVSRTFKMCTLNIFWATLTINEAKFVIKGQNKMEARLELLIT